MIQNIAVFLLHWGVTALSLWVASFLFRGIRFDSRSSLLVAALVLGFLNAVVRPLVILLTLPLTLLTFGLFLLVINALLLMLVSALVRGFSVSGFWTAFFASIFITLMGMFLGLLLFGGGDVTWQSPVSTPTRHPWV